MYLSHKAVHANFTPEEQYEEEELAELEEAIMYEGPETIAGFVLDRLLARLHARKAELLLVLDRPEIPLHTNGSENDIRCHVTKRRVSGGTWSEAGRDARDACLGLMKTCRKVIQIYTSSIVWM